MQSQENIPPRWSEPSRHKRTLAIAVAFAAAGAAAAAVLFVFNPSQHGFYPFCMFHRLTGLLCPGCGSLRALHELLHGHFAEALRLNFLLVTSLPVLAFFFIRDFIRRRNGTYRPMAIPQATFWTCLVLILLFGVIRNVPYLRGTAFAF